MTTKNQIQTNCETKLKNSWTASDKKKLVECLTVVIEGQKAYGQQRSVKSVFNYFKMKFDGRYSVDSLIYAIDKYTDIQNDIPAPADINKILNPEPPRITEAEFVEAQKWQERNGYPIMSDAKKTIEAYRKQESDKRKNHDIKSDQIKSIVKNSYKRIGNE